MLNMGFIEDIESILAEHHQNVKHYFSLQQCQDQFKEWLKSS